MEDRRITILGPVAAAAFRDVNDLQERLWRPAAGLAKRSRRFEPHRVVTRPLEMRPFQTPTS